MNAWDVNGGRILLCREKEGLEREETEVVWNSRATWSFSRKRRRIVSCFSGGVDPSHQSEAQDRLTIKDECRLEVNTAQRLYQTSNQTVVTEIFPSSSP